MSGDVWVTLAVAAVIVATALVCLLIGFGWGRDVERVAQAGRDRMMHAVRKADQ